MTITDTFAFWLGGLVLVFVVFSTGLVDLGGGGSTSIGEVDQFFKQAHASISAPDLGDGLVSTLRSIRETVTGHVDTLLRDAAAG